MQDDSSSEETPNSTANNKPIVPPRPRNLGFDHKSKILINNLSGSPGNAGKQRSSVTNLEDYEGTDRKYIATDLRWNKLLNNIFYDLQLRPKCTM